MRLDVFLSASRLVKRRSTAKRLAEEGAVRVEGQPAKAARPLQVGDELEIRLGRRTLRVRVLGLTERSVSREEARKLFEILEENFAEEDPRPSPSTGVMDFLKRS